MTGEESRPGGQTQAAQVSVTNAEQILPAERAHLYGVGGVSQTEAAAQVRRALGTMADCWPEMLTQVMRRAVQQAFLEALPAYWVRRSEQLSTIGTPWADDAARACRQHAWLLAQGLPDELAAEVDDYLMAEAV